LGVAKPLFLPILTDGLPHSAYIAAIIINIIIL